MDKTYQNAVNILTSKGKFHINLGLERVQKFLKLIDNPQNKLNFIHVAGTNGKGSVCAMLSQILKDNGYKVGLFTSPHIFKYTERIKINGEDIPSREFANLIDDVVGKANENGIDLTEFEILTVVAFYYFAKNEVDIVCLETGLGGRFDATNVIKDNICSIITHIDFDHTERLGNTIEKIAFEKAGIIKNNCPVIINSNNFGRKIIESVAQDKKSNCFIANTNNIDEFSDFKLNATYQKENFDLVKNAIDVLNNSGFLIQKINNSLKKVNHPCRFQYIKEYNLIIDGAHNPNGSKALRESLEFYYPNQTYNFIFGCLKNKKYEQMMQNLFKENDKIYFYHYNYPNSCSVEELQTACKYDSNDFSQYVCDTNLTVICGSFYMIKVLLENMGIKK